MTTRPGFRLFYPAPTATIRIYPGNLAMTNLSITDDLFFNRAGLDRTKAETLLGEALSGAEDGADRQSIM